jgi:hypothetical protein
VSDADDGIIWKSAGLHLVGASVNGRLPVSADLLRAYWTRPEIHPIAESCAMEHRLFERLMADPFAEVSVAELAAIVDRDAAENYAMVLGLRDHLVAAGSIEAGYRALFEPGAPRVPPVFVDQLVHLVVADMLRDERDAFVARSAELFFREQVSTTSDERIMLADAEMVERLGGNAALLAGQRPREVELETLTPETADLYRARADRFDFGLDFRFGQPAQNAFARVIEMWLARFFDLPVQVLPLRSVRDQPWVWHIGLDAEATRILNALYRGETLPVAGQGRIAALFRMEILEPERVIERVRGRPVFLGLSVDANGRVRMKPQNLLTNLPLLTTLQ